MSHDGQEALRGRQQPGPHHRAPILELLDITKDTPLEVRTDGEALIIRAVKKAPLMELALAAADRLMDAHEGLFAMAAAHLFHIVSNHPFVDGDKRAGAR